MTPKEKAKELIDKYLNAAFNCKDCDMPFCDAKCTILNTYEAKQCALIAVTEIINICPFIGIDFAKSEGAKESDAKEYWIDVKNELSNL